MFPALAIKKKKVFKKQSSASCILLGMCHTGEEKPGWRVWAYLKLSGQVK